MEIHKLIINVKRIFNNKIIKFSLILLLSSLILVFFFLHKHYQAKPSYLSGDEPHYIMMTDSLSKDRDFNLKNDYELNRSRNYFDAPEHFPHLSTLIDQKSDKWYSIHTIGLPLIIVIPYYFFGVDGARIWLMILQFSILFIFYQILKKYIKNKSQQYLGIALLIVCPIFWQNLGSIYPDSILVTIWGLIILLFPRKDRISNILIMGLTIIAAMAHSKGLVLIAPLILFQALWLIKENSFLGWLKKYWTSIAVLVVGVVYYAYFLHHGYGVYSPSQLYGNNSNGSQLFSANPVYNVVAMLTDRNKGLLVHFPLIAIALPYVYLAFNQLVFTLKKYTKAKKLKLKAENYLIGGLVLGCTFLLVTLIGFNDWSGSTAPNGRSMFPLIIALIFIVSKYADFKNRIQIFILGCVGLLSAWLSWLSISDFKYYMSTGVNSFWVDRFHPLTNLPIFTLIATGAGRVQVTKGLKILFILLILNILLIILYKYKVKFIKRSKGTLK